MRSRAVVKRKPVPAEAQLKHQTYMFPAPIRGWVANESLAMSKPGAATVLENWFPTQTGIKVRGGSKRKATVSSVIVESLLNYASGSVKKMFAASGGSIYNITSPASPTVPPVADVTGRTSNYYSYVQFATVGGDFMVTVNGTDLHLVYDGAAWAVNTPAITNVSSANLSQVWNYKNRLFFVEKGKKKAWYLPVDSIGGAALSVSLEGVFQRGGALMFGATWSMDAGDGLDDKCVFVSTNGEVLIYEGSDPSSSTTWSLVGRYDFSVPLGLRGQMRAGGDLLIACVDGIVPISEAINKDPAALSLAAITRAIEPEWKTEVAARVTRPWEIAKWPEKNMAIVSMPVTNATQGQAQVFVANIETGAWAKYYGWDVQCLVYHDGNVYFGTNDGKILQCETGGTDDGAPYYCRYAGLFEGMGARGAAKHIIMARPTFVYSQNFIAKTSVSTNYVINFPSAPSSISSTDLSSAWDVALWDSGIWQVNSGGVVKSKWLSIGRTGYAISPTVQITSSTVQTPDVELVSIDVTYRAGGVVV